MITICGPPPLPGMIMITDSMGFFYPFPKHRKHFFLSWDKTVFKMWSQIFETILNFALNVLWTKSYFESYNAFFFFNFWDHIFKKVLSQTLFIFSMLSSRMEHKKKLLKHKQQCTFVYIINFLNCYRFWGFLLLCGLVSNIFTIFFRGSEVCLVRCDSYGNFVD